MMRNARGQGGVARLCPPHRHECRQPHIPTALPSTTYQQCSKAGAHMRCSASRYSRSPRCIMAMRHEAMEPSPCSANSAVGVFNTHRLFDSMVCDAA